ncbi:MAG: glycosyltransferase family 4 protein [Rhodanobacteraceae bacterium]
MRIWLPSIRARSGSDVYVERLADGLRSHGVEPIVQWFPLGYQYFPWALRREPPPPRVDIINANSWIAFAFRRHNIPLIATIHHCVAGRGYPQWKSFFQMLFHDCFVYRFERASFRAADAVVAVSDSTRREASDGFHAVNIRVIPNWVDTHKFSPAEQKRRGGSAPTRILIVGNMGRRKGGDLIGPFCDALGRQFEVVVVAGLRGDAPKVSERGARLRFVSGLTVDQLVATYRDTDIVVSLSRHEGFGYTALEGMACGKPVVAFDVPGLRDVIVHQTTGMLAPVANTQALAQACHVLRTNPELAHALGEQGRKRATTLFTEDRAMEAHLALYREILRR